MRVFSLVYLYFSIIDSFLMPPNIFKVINNIHNKKINFLKTNIDNIVNVTRRTNQRKYEILSLIFEDDYTSSRANKEQSDSCFFCKKQLEETELCNFCKKQLEENNDLIETVCKEDESCDSSCDL